MDRKRPRSETPPPPDEGGLRSEEERRAWADARASQAITNAKAARAQSAAAEAEPRGHGDVDADAVRPQASARAQVVEPAPSVAQVAGSAHPPTNESYTDVYSRSCHIPNLLGDLKLDEFEEKLWQAGYNLTTDMLCAGLTEMIFLMDALLMENGHRCALQTLRDVFCTI